jgi:A/G-specific adenine glycosylase
MLTSATNRVNVSFSRRLIRWFDRTRRDLPWRAAPPARPDPYHVLVSEAMLQQTQVKTVIPYFNRFIRELPTIQALANADEQLVLRLWQGLGYYSRARNLRRAAQQIMQVYGGRVPADVPSLLKLPGIGRYTAGAIASIAYDVPAPIVDGNVARVLCRLDAIRSHPSESATQAILWRRAGQLVPARRAGDFNSAMMELGAIVCMPRSPQCQVCPVKQYCRAHELKIQSQIPAPRPGRKLPLVVRRTFCLRRAVKGRTVWLIEQRPGKGRWAGLWQFLTRQADSGPASDHGVGELTCVKTTPPRQIGCIHHVLSHRRYRFDVYLCDVRGRGNASKSTKGRIWVRLDQLGNYPLPRPHVRIAGILRQV